MEGRGSEQDCVKRGGRKASFGHRSAFRQGGGRGEMMRGSMVLVLLAGLGLSGCVVTPPPPLLVAYPGPNKTEPLFRADDAACQGEAVRGPVVSAPAPAAASRPGGPVTPGNSVAVTSAGEVPTLTPGIVYLRCMAMRDNVVQPLVTRSPTVVVYRNYPAYPVYSGFGDYYPWLYGGYGDLDYYGRFGGYRGYGFRDGYAFHDGFRGHEGFRDGGFRGGGWHR